MSAYLPFFQIPEIRRPYTSFPGGFENGGIGVVDFVHESASLVDGGGEVIPTARSLWQMKINLTSHSCATIKLEQPWAPVQPHMGRQPAKSPVVIDLVDSDSDIEIIHHTIVVLDDETPPKPGHSRSTLQQVCLLHTLIQNTGSDSHKERNPLTATPHCCQSRRHPSSHCQSGSPSTFH